MARRRGRTAGGEALLPGYSDLQEIGGGAFATVFRAVEVETGRPVALKILKVDTIHAHLIETFHHEIQALAAVSDHPNIVTLYRPSTTADGRPVLVLELCRESLGQQLRTAGPLDAPEVTRIGIKIAGALETAHRNGFLHRDMKPQNILITQFGEPALADFGVAALQASAQMTAGVFGFTTLHAAPEMLEGHHLSPATDVYGLASTMYQLLTGQAPFATYENEAPASVILRILRDPVRPLRAEHIPLDLADLLEAALSKQPEGRPRTAAEFATALQAVEVANGWPETSFIAWGEEGVAPPAPASPRAERGPMGVVVGPGGGAGGGTGAGVAGAGAGVAGAGGVSGGRGGPAAASAGGAGGADGLGGAGTGGAEVAGGAGAVARDHGPAGAGPRGDAPAARSTLPPLLPPSTPPAAAAPAGTAPPVPAPGPTGPAPTEPAAPAVPPAVPTAAPAPAAPPVPPAAAATSDRPAQSASGTSEPPSPPSPPVPPAPPAPPVRPSLVTPEPGRRNVVAPVDAVRGRFGPPGEGGGRREANSAPAQEGGGAEPGAPGSPSASPPPPPSLSPRVSSAFRPTFVDPDPSDRPHTTSVYEETMGVQQLYDRPARRPPAPSPGATAESQSQVFLPMWAVAALVVAVLVIVAGVLVVTGVI